jgi:hypothetical protein
MLRPAFVALRRRLKSCCYLQGGDALGAEKSLLVAVRMMVLTVLLRVVALAI